ncbi:hypothetical protein PspLS_08259 [Pyricularia sp. CBS 133598]|nr:hypothetical protein PspLS_08259 [Pyricularia sp. CBS 133598]
MSRDYDDAGSHGGRETDRLLTRLVTYRFETEDEVMRFEWSAPPFVPDPTRADVQKPKILTAEEVSYMVQERRRPKKSTLDCLVQFLSSIHQRMGKKRDLRITRPTSVSSVTKYMRPGEVYGCPDKHMHVILRFCTEKHYGHNGGFSAHLYTKPDGSYDAGKNLLWHGCSGFTPTDRKVKNKPKPVEVYYDGYL